MDLLDRGKLEKAYSLLADVRRLADVKDTGQISLGRTIEAASRGAIYEIAGAAERWGSLDRNPQKLEIPFADLADYSTRDLTGALASSGGYLAATTTDVVTLPLVGAGVVRAGANVITNVRQNTTNPHIGAKPTFEWLSSESSQLSIDNTLVLGQTAVCFKRGGISVRASRQLRLQSDLDSVLARLLTQMANDALDLAVLNGSGAAGQPLGVFGTTGVQSVSGASLGLAGLCEMEDLTTLADTEDSKLTWFGYPTVRRVLRQREIATGSGSLWPGRELLGHPALVSSKMPSASLILGDFSNIDILLFGSGIEVLVNPFANFKAGQIEFQVSLQMDVVVHYPASFVKATGVN